MPAIGCVRLDRCSWAGNTEVQRAMTRPASCVEPAMRQVRSACQPEAGYRICGTIEVILEAMRLLRIQRAFYPSARLLSGHAPRLRDENVHRISS